MSIAGEVYCKKCGKKRWIGFVYFEENKMILDPTCRHRVVYELKLVEEG